MKNKFKILTLLMVFFLLFTLVACSDDADNYQMLDEEMPVDDVDDNSNPVELGELTVGLMPSIDAFPIVIAHDRGYFADEGLTVTLESFSSATDRDAALQAGLLDATLFDLVAVALSREADIKPLSVTGLTTGRFTLVANEGFDTIEDLASETVVISQNTAIDFVLDQMVSLAGFDNDHLNTLAIPAIPARLEYLRAGNVAAALLPEPWATIAMAEGLQEITNTIEIGIIPFVTAFTDEAIETMPQEIRAFYRAYNRGVDFLNASELDDYFHIMVDVIGFPEEVAAHLILPTFAHNQIPEDHVLEATISWLLSRDLITEGMTTEDLIDRVAFE
jgi:NitT/TauT family transport system substrate-binding protein